MATSVLLRPALGATQAEYSEYIYDAAATPAASSNTADSEAATGVWNYMAGVSLLLILWVLSLMLPKGMRKQFFGANPRRYWRRRYPASELGEYSTSMSAMDTVDESILLEVEKRRLNDMSVSMGPSSTLPSSSLTPSSGMATQQQKQQQHYIQQQMQQKQQQHLGLPPRSKGSTTGSDQESGIGSLYLRPMARSTARRAYAGAFPTHTMPRASPTLMGNRSTSPSPGHPAIPRLPSAKILNETMQRLKSRGIRLVAHGVASDSKRVWIKFEEDTSSLSWQTEFPRKIPNQLGEVSLVMMRGALHRIALPNILYVDVGKKTNALMKAENRDILDSVCFSLLTQNGSLDLQANSRLERDALVSCFSMVLDEVHTQDWRSLYAESPGTSAVQSSCTGSDLNQVEF
jgi:hypothetical protein